MKRIAVYLVATLSMVAVVGSSALAAEEPLWEIGGGLGVTSLPDYRGAEEGHTYVLPIPYIVYRGDKFKVDRGGVHGALARTDALTFDVSGGLSPPAKSDENAARSGMPDIDPSLEIGPSLQWLWYRSAARDKKFSLYLPVRAVVTTKGEYVGWVFSPNINLDVFNFSPSGGWKASVSIGPLYASEKYHDYFYEVSSQYATATRPAYNAGGGYSGSRLTLTFGKRFPPHYWLGIFTRYDSLNDAVFEDSPLVRQSHSFMAGIGLSYIFARSSQMVEVRGDSY